MMGVKAVRLLVLDPDLGARLAPGELVRAQRDLLVLGVELSRGEVDPLDMLIRPEIRGRPFGALVLEGVLVERLSLDERPCARLVGARDLLTLESYGTLPTGSETSLEVLQPAFLAILDDRFLAATQRWPALTASLMERSIERAREGLLAKTISQLPRVEERLLALFQLLAQRWGRLRTDGVIVELALTHDLIGELIGARRPTVSLGLRTLNEAGALRLLRGEGWLLAGAGELVSQSPSIALPDGPETAIDTADELLLVGVVEPLASRLAHEFPAARWAGTGRAALAALADRPGTGVVVVDLSSPDLGSWAIRLVEGLRASEGARVIALTHGAVPGTELLEAAAHDHVHGSADPLRVTAAISEQRAVFRNVRGDMPQNGSASAA